MSKVIDYIQSISEVKIADVVSTSPDALYHRKKNVAQRSRHNG